jgi:hypothetical protein
VSGLSSLLFVVKVDSGRVEKVRRRERRLVDFYSPLGVTRASVRHLPALGLLVGEYAFAPAGVTDAGRLTRGGEPAEWQSWGGPLPSWLDADALVTAGDERLRALDRTLAAFAAGPRSARLVTGCAGATSLYSARADGIEAWATHAVAAAYLARAEVTIDTSALPELFAAEFVGDTRTHLVGVTAVPRATVVEFTPGSRVTRSYWPIGDRYGFFATGDAFDAAERILVQSLAERVAGGRSVELGLTAGADSRVAAVALREAGRDFDAVTVAGESGSADARGAAAVADELGVRHRIRGFELQPDEDAVAVIDAEVRWVEGLAPLNGFAVGEPESSELVVTGGGGEIARAWYYRWQARNYRRPTRAQLARVLSHLHWRIDGATSDAHDLLDAAILGWIDAALGAGQEGWSALDLAYDEQRLQRWGRAHLPRSRAPLLYAFSTPALTQAFLSLPLSDRIGDGFHRRFLARHAPSLMVPPPPTQRRRVPRLARRLAAAARDRHGLRHTAVAPDIAALLANRPRTRAYIAEDALERDLLASVMGVEWVRRVRRGFVAGRQHEVTVAFRATAIAALETALSELNAR